MRIRFFALVTATIFLIACTTQNTGNRFIRAMRPDEVFDAVFSKAESAIYEHNAPKRAKQLRLTMDILNKAPTVSWHQDGKKLDISSLDYVITHEHLKNYGNGKAVKNQISKALTRVSIGAEYLWLKTIYYLSAVESDEFPTVSNSIVLFGKGPIALFPNGHAKVEYQQDGFCYIDSPKQKHCFVAMEDTDGQAYLVSTDGVEHRVLLIANGDPMNIQKTAAINAAIQTGAYRSEKAREAAYQNCVDAGEEASIYSDEEYDPDAAAGSCLTQMLAFKTINDTAYNLAYSHRERRVQVESDEIERLADNIRLHELSKDMHAYASAYLDPRTSTKSPPVDRAKVERKGVPRWVDTSFSMSKISLSKDPSGHESAAEGEHTGALERAPIKLIADRTIVALAPEYITDSEAINFVGHRFYVDSTGSVHNRIHPAGKVDKSTNGLSIQTYAGAANYALYADSTDTPYLVCTSGPNKDLVMRIVSIVEGDPLGLSTSPAVQ